MDTDKALHVPDAEKARRRGEVMQAQQEIVFKRHAAIAAEFDEHRPTAGGRKVDVLIDTALKSKGRATSGVGKGGRLYQGRTAGQAPSIDSVTFVQSAAERSPGELVPCVITGWDGYDLVARPVDEIEKRVALKVL